MRPLPIILGGLAAAAVILPLGYFLVIGYALRPSCGVDHVQTGQSPDGRYAYSTFWKGCGAATRWTQGVALRPADEPFIDDAAHTVVVVRGTDPIQVTWKDAHSVEIAVAPFADIFPKMNKWEDLSISVVHREKF